MAHPRRFRFGVQLSQPLPGCSWADSARRVESLGFSTLFLPDHFGDQLSPIVGMAAAASATTELRVGALVLDNDYRHPVVLAKDLASIDVISGGRVEWGLGAGWMLTDYEQSGIPHDPARVRIDRFEEAVTVMKRLFADGPASFEGDHYRVTALDGRPVPVQRPHPPLLIGGGGRRMLSIAGREADIVGVNPAMRSGRIDATAAADATAARVDQKLAWLREAAGERFDDLEINCLLFAVMVTDDARRTAENMAPLFDLTPDEVLAVPFALFGPVPEMIDRLHERRDRFGMSYVVVQGDAIEAMAPIVDALAGT